MRPSIPRTAYLHVDAARHRALTCWRRAFVYVTAEIGQ